VSPAADAARAAPEPVRLIPVPMIWCTASSAPTAPDPLWVQGVTQHCTSEGWVYLAVVIDAWSRRVVGWSIADHMRAELVTDAIDMATWRRRPPAGAIAHSVHGSNYCSWVFGQRLSRAGLLGSMGTVGDAFDNAVAESFFAPLQCELLD
jgi:putative transposase